MGDAQYNTNLWLSANLCQPRHRLPAGFAVYRHHSFLSQYGSSLLGGMSQATVTTNKKFILWLNANGLDVPRDFKFAFTSASKAAEACPEAPDSAAQAWEAIDYDEVEVPSSWTLWVQRPRSAIKPQAQQPGRAPAKFWRGLQAQKLRQSQGPKDDFVRRQSAARDALNLALSWKGRGRMAGEWCSLPVTRRDDWFQRQLARIAGTEARTVHSALRTWKHWCAWCSQHGEDSLQPTGTAPMAFLYASASQKQGNKLPKTLPTTRFNHMRWLESALGSPVRMAASDRPARHDPGEGLSAEQRVATDPEVHLHLDRLFAQLPPADPARVVIAAIQVLWMGVLRFQHMQRSVPVRLTTSFLHGVCWKGKGKPGYRWACPRYGPTGADICGFLWDAWQRVAASSPETPFGLLRDSGKLFSLSDFHVASRSILREHLGMTDTDIFSSYSLRRSMPTLAEMGGIHPDDADALGDWTSAKDSKMRIRYADSREERSATVKLTHVLLVRQMASSEVALSWVACRHLLASVDNKAIAMQAAQLMASDSNQEETQSRFLGALGRAKRKFNIEALSRHASRLAHAPPVLPVVPEQPALQAEPSAQIGSAHVPDSTGAARRWVMIKHKGAPRVHLLPADSEVPLCRRRRGQMGKPIVRMASMGTGLSELHQMGWSKPDTVCAICLATLPDGERVVLAGC